LPDPRNIFKPRVHVPFVGIGSIPHWPDYILFREKKAKKDREMAILAVLAGGELTGANFNFGYMKMNFLKYK
jgi:hypothetical protein